MAPAWGHVRFWEPHLLHPTCLLLLWAVITVAVQFAGALPLVALAFLLVLFPGVATGWWRFLRRARWLLLALWLILAYGKPGEALADLAWAPTYEGLLEANLHALRLFVMLGCLAWLFVRLGHDGLVSALWGALQPLRRLSADVERVVVRLALVLENLQQPVGGMDWRRMLHEAHAGSATDGHLQLVLPDWRQRDRVFLVGLLALVVAAGVWA